MLDLLLAASSALLLVLVFPTYNFTWLAPFALTPLLIAAARERRFLRRFLLGEAAGILYWAGVCYWIQFVLSYHGQMGEPGGWGAFLLFCLFKSLHLGLFTALAGLLIPYGWAVPAVAALWIGLERTHGPLGFAWLALGNAGVDMALPMRLAPVLGVYGLSFVFAMLAAAVALLALRRPRRHLLWLGVLALLLLLPPLPQTPPGTEQVVTLQPNIPLDEDIRGPAVGQVRRELFRLSLQSALTPAEPPPALLVWPEVPLPLYYESDPSFQRETAALARAASAPFLFGTVAFTKDGSPLNSAQWVSSEGKPLARYDKMFLVPFGEFVPPFFGWVNRISKESGDFVRGDKVVVVPLDGHGVGAFICYEAVFPHLVPRFTRAGAEVLFNLSNDGYFGRSSARHQHLLIARMRAAENRRWLIRSTNNGITVSIDPAGRIRQTLAPDFRTAARLRFGYEKGLTFYSRYGDWFAWSSLAASLAAALWAWWPKHSR